MPDCRKSHLILRLLTGPPFPKIPGSAPELADPEKIMAILNMRSPNNKKEKLRRFLGTYLGTFSPNLSDVTAPLRNLLKQDAPWTWSEVQEEVEERLKNDNFTSSTRFL